MSGTDALVTGHWSLGAWDCTGTVVIPGAGTKLPTIHPLCVSTIVPETESVSCLEGLHKKCYLVSRQSSELGFSERDGGL